MAPYTHCRERIGCYPEESSGPASSMWGRGKGHSALGKVQLDREKKDPFPLNCFREGTGFSSDERRTGLARGSTIAFIARDECVGMPRTELIAIRLHRLLHGDTSPFTDEGKYRDDLLECANNRCTLQAFAVTMIAIFFDAFRNGTDLGKDTMQKGPIE